MVIDLIILAIAVVGVVIGIAAAIVLFMRWRRNRFRFSLKVLLVLFVAVACALFIVVDSVVPLVTQYARDDNRAGVVAHELVNLPEVKRFCLIDVSDKGLTEICNAAADRSIDGLYFIESPVTSRGLNRLATVKSVWHLSFNTCPISDGDLTPLKTVSGLKALSLVEEDNNANPARFSERGFQQVGQIEGLNRLLMVGLTISDASAVYLKTLSNLKSLIIRNCRISDESVSELRKSLPTCQVDTDGPIPEWFFKN
jgi:4-amino-4-deoxy-L-arabinose transferase-like glycosyltransferase